MYNRAKQGPGNPHAANLELMRRALDRGNEESALNLAGPILASNDPKTLFTVARLFSDAGMTDHSLSALQSCAELDPDNPIYHLVLARTFEQLGRMDKGAREYRATLALDADNAAAMHGLASNLVSRGDTEEAEDLLFRAVHTEPRLATAHYLLASLRSYQSNDDPHINQLRSLLGNPAQWPVIDYSRLAFSLGHALDRLGSFGEAFLWIEKANKARKTQSAFDVARERGLVNDRIQHYTSQLKKRMQHSGFDASWPVLIVGMPRSGTTLVEQILASHPLVHGAGEVMDLQHCLAWSAKRYLGDREELPSSAAKMPKDGWMAAGRAYAERLQQYQPAAGRVIDKQLFNYLELGAANLMLSNLKIIHCVRDPMDTLWSCFFNAFRNDRGFTHDFDDLGNAWLLYRQLMRHWNSQVPGIYELQYEDLVADVAGGARNLIEFLELEWDDACLSFASNPRRVTTASQVQVRQEIFKSSIGRWKSYQRQLQPLRDIIETD